MKRSYINTIIIEAEAFFSAHGFHLPVWSQWSMQEWKAKAGTCTEIFSCNLGWDITDFSSGDFMRRGLVLFTLRNGDPSGSGKSYAEKIMMVREDQETPFHFHWHKMEDIINRGGGTLAFELYQADENEGFRDEPFTIQIDGVTTPVKPGEPLYIAPGQSLCLERGLYHRFYAKAGTGPVLCGEVSMVNDDHADNRFKEPIGRFPGIEEDEPPVRLMVGDYRNLLGDPRGSLDVSGSPK
ncbi:MAG: D-lyxose/D-mannose family sugar isomerase [Clostridia bacterium]|jgi:D-lyxose ketol-isomerase